jgi:hypothetical protein
MKQLRLEPRDGNDFKVYIEDEYIGSTNSPRWYSWGTRDITTADGVVYNLRPSAFLGFEFELRFDDKLLYEIRSGNVGNVIVFRKNNTIAYAMKREQNFVKSNLVLVDGNGSAQLIIQSKFNWREFETKYTISISEEFGNSDLEKAIVVLTMMFYDSLHDNND